LRCVVHGLADDRWNLYDAGAQRHAQRDAKEKQKCSTERRREQNEPADAPDAKSSGH
jgi:hypothetical protein